MQNKEEIYFQKKLQNLALGLVFADTTPRTLSLDAHGPADDAHIVVGCVVLSQVSHITFPSVFRTCS